MPVRRTRRRRRRTRKSVGRKALTLAKKAWDHIDHEYHRNYLFINNFALDDVTLGTAQAIYLTSLNEGVGEADRSGNAVQVHSLHLTGDVRIDTASSGVGQSVRIALVWDRCNLQDFPLYEDVYQDNNASGDATCPYWKRNRVQMKRFQVLKEVNILLSQFHQSQKFSLSRVIKKQAKFLGTTGAIGDCERGLFVVACSSGGTNVPLMKFVSDLAFAP